MRDNVGLLCELMCIVISSSVPTLYQALQLCKELDLTIMLEVKAFVGFGPPKVSSNK